MTTKDIIDKMYGVTTYESTEPLNSTIQTTPTQIVSNDPGALQMTLINLGANDLYLWRDESVSATKGILIASNGGAYEINFTTHLRMPTFSWWAIAPAGATEIAVMRESILT